MKDSLVSRIKVMAALVKEYNYRRQQDDWPGGLKLAWIEKAVNSVQAIADVRPVVRGEWIPEEEKHLWKCSVCGNIIFSEDAVDKKVYHAFCGKCGAVMRGDGE